MSVSSIRSGIRKMQTDSELEKLKRRLDETPRKFSLLEDRLGKARGRAFVYANDLEEKIARAAHRWKNLDDRVYSAYHNERSNLDAALQSVNAEADRLSDEDEAGISRVQSRVRQLEREIKQAIERIEGIYDDVREGMRQLEEQMEEIDDVLTEKDEASFAFLDGESVIMVCDAEWAQTGKSRQDPDGNLFLTDKRVIFEQKEKTGKMLGLFGGKKVQELEWAVQFDQITNVEAEDVGMLGRKGMLKLLTSGGAPEAELVLELKKGASNEEWAAIIEKGIHDGFTDEHVDNAKPYNIENFGEFKISWSRKKGFRANIEGVDATEALNDAIEDARSDTNPPE